MMAASPKEAKLLGAAQYFTGKPCCRGHVAARRTSDRGCVECGPLRSKKHYDANHDEYLAKQRVRQEQNREEIRAAARRWKAKNADRVRAYAAQYRADNSDRLQQADRQRRQAEPDKYREMHRRWVANNRGRKNLLTAVRLAHVKRATPPWLTETDKAAIAAIYEKAARLTVETGIQHHVDHIIPLRGETVSGLHVPSNLQVLTASENSRKRNKFNPNPNS